MQDWGLIVLISSTIETTVLNVIQYANGDGNDIIYGLKSTDTISITGGSYSN